MIASVLRSAACGQFPPKSNEVVLVPPVEGARAAVVAMTNFIIVAADVSRQWVDAHLDGDDISSSMSPGFISALQAEVGGVADNLDMLLAAPSTSAARSVGLRPVDDGFVHARLTRARALRKDVEAFVDGDGALVLVGRGLDGRCEVAVDVPEHLHGRGKGKQLAGEARRLVPPGAFVFAQVAPGNTASVRAFLSAGFVPVASEVLVHG